MSKARLLIEALRVPGATVADVAARYGVHRSWVYRLWDRYRVEGDAAFEPRSRRPKTSPRQTPPATVAAIVAEHDRLKGEGHDAGCDTVRWHLEHDQHVGVSRATVHRILTRAGKITAQPEKRPKSSYIRFQADLPNECWQSDFTHYRLFNAVDVEIISWLDDHSRHALSATAHLRITGLIVLTTFQAAVAIYGPPAATLTDNGMVYTTRLAGGRGGRNRFENELRRHGIVQKNSRPNHPTTCGKIERFQQTLKNWLRRQPDQPSTIAALQALLDRFVDDYNHRRPHRSLPGHATPATAYTARPKALPGSRDHDTHTRVRHDIIDKSGRVTLRHNGHLHHIGIGRTHARTRILLLVADLDIRIINAATGEILRNLTLDTSRDYQPQKPNSPNPT